VRPNIISHGANAKPPADSPERSRFQLEMDFLGTMDYSPWLCVPEAIRFNGSLLPGGWEELRARNHALTLQARDLLCRELGAEPPAPDDMLGTMACVPLPDRTPEEASRPTKYHDALQDALVHRHAIQVPIIPFAIPPKTGTRYVRISANVYNTMEQYEYLVKALKQELRGVR
jgi:isopenicillin-N epimerase